jgi:hypothetical protein
MVATLIKSADGKAGLGLLGSIMGDKAADSIEDTTSKLSDYNYIAEFFSNDETPRSRCNLCSCRSRGGITFEPILNLKTRRCLPV